MTEKPATCEARLNGGTYHCLRCRLSWDYGDPEPPPCKIEMTEAEKKNERAARAPATRRFYG